VKVFGPDFRDHPDSRALREPQGSRDRRDHLGRSRPKNGAI